MNRPILWGRMHSDPATNPHQNDAEGAPKVASRVGFPGFAGVSMVLLVALTIHAALGVRGSGLLSRANKEGAQIRLLAQALVARVERVARRQEHKPDEVAIQLAFVGQARRATSPESACEQAHRFELGEALLDLPPPSVG